MSQSAYNVTVELAETYKVLHNYEKALQHLLTLLDKATQKEAKNIHLIICDMYIDWAIFNSEHDELDESYKHLDNALEYNPLNSEIYYNKALNKITQRDYAASVEFLHKALEYNKTKDMHPKYYLKLSEAHYYLGNFFEEKKALNDLLKIDEKNPMGLYRTGLMYAKQGDTKSAEEALKMAVENPLLETSIRNAKSVLVYYTGDNINMMELTLVNNQVHEDVDADAQIIFGAMESDDMNDEMKVTVIAAGFDNQDIGDAMDLDTKTTISAAQADEVDSSRRRRSSASDDFDVPTFLQNRK